MSQACQGNGHEGLQRDGAGTGWLVEPRTSAPSVVSRVGKTSRRPLELHRAMGNPRFGCRVGGDLAWNCRLGQPDANGHSGLVVLGSFAFVGTGLTPLAAAQVA